MASDKQEINRNTKKEREASLYQLLKEYGESDYYGFHMPGHKRRPGGVEYPFQIDITEIDGFDDLHHPQKNGVLVQAQGRAACLYGAEETHFLVNGSTAGILSAISGCTSQNGRILMARNCHRSVYHAAVIGNLDAVYIYPQRVENMWINGAILPEDVDFALTSNEGIQAVVITSPTYDGVCSDIRGIAESCHRAQVPLIVDQAHGAHFPFSEYFPEDALTAGADVVIHSVHKTLPSLTQTALLHINGKLANREKIRFYLSVYQSSSPSYVLMASIDRCMELLEEKGEELFRDYICQLKDFREKCQDLCNLSLEGDNFAWGKAVWDFDQSKLLVSTGNSGITGTELARLLLERYHIQMEMATPYYLVGISSVADTKEGFMRLSQALHELDAEIGQKLTAPKTVAVQEIERTWAPVRMGTALEHVRELIDMKECEGRTAAAFTYLYPPGIPLLAPGEMILPGILRQIQIYQEAGLEIHGLIKGTQIFVLN